MSLVDGPGIKADKSSLGGVRFDRGIVSACDRSFIDTPTGRILATESIEGDSVKALRTDFKSKARDFFSKGGMVLASAVDVSQRTPDTSHPSPTLSPSAPAAVTPSPSSVVSPPATETPSAASATTPSAPPTLARSPTVAPPAATEATDAAPPDVVPPQLPAWKGGQRFHHLAVRVGFGGFNGAVGIGAEYRFIRYASLSVGGSVSGWTAQEGGNNEWYGFPAPWGGGLAVTAALTGYLPLYFHGSPYASLQFGTAIGGSSGLGLTVGWDWIRALNPEHSHRSWRVRGRVVRDGGCVLGFFCRRRVPVARSASRTGQPGACRSSRCVRRRCRVLNVRRLIACLKAPWALSQAWRVTHGQAFGLATEALRGARA